MGLSQCIGTSHRGSTRLCVQTFQPLQCFCRLPLPLSLLSGWVVTVGIVRQSLRLSRVALPPLLLSQALNADTPPQKGERCQTTANLSEAHWKDWKQVAGETSKSQFMRVAISFKSWNNPLALHNAFWDKFWNATTTSSDVGLLSYVIEMTQVNLCSET